MSKQSRANLRHCKKGKTCGISAHVDHDQVEEDFVVTLTAGSGKTLLVKEKTGGKMKMKGLSHALEGGDAYVMVG